MWWANEAYVVEDSFFGDGRTNFIRFERYSRFGGEGAFAGAVERSFCGGRNIRPLRTTDSRVDETPSMKERCFCGRSVPLQNKAFLVEERPYRTRGIQPRKKESFVQVRIICRRGSFAGERFNRVGKIARVGTVPRGRDMGWRWGWIC